MTHGNPKRDWTVEGGDLVSSLNRGAGADLVIHTRSSSRQKLPVGEAAMDDWVIVLTVVVFLIFNDDDLKFVGARTAKLHV